jgi:molybdenum cofactor guanylyltransferase
MSTRRARRGVLLAGGASARFGGTPKGIAPLGSARLADYPLRALQAVCDDVCIAANDPRAENWFPGLGVVSDAVPGLGALGALATALGAGRGEITVVCAWDMPFVTAELLDALASAVEDGAPCAIPQHPDGMLEPLCGAYGPAAIPVLDDLLARAERAAQTLPHALGGHRWPLAPITMDAPPPCFNVNTAADLERARAWLCLPSVPA